MCPLLDTHKGPGYSLSDGLLVAGPIRGWILRMTFWSVNSIVASQTGCHQITHHAGCRPPRATSLLTYHLSLITNHFPRLALAAVLLLCACLSPAFSEPLPLHLARTRSGAAVALARDGGQVLLLWGADAGRPDLLGGRTVLQGAAGAPLGARAAGAVACFLDAAERLHAVWETSDAACYARCPLADVARRDAWRGALGRPSPDLLAAGLVPDALVVAGGMRPVVAGTCAGKLVLLRCDDAWHESLSVPGGSRPALARDPQGGVAVAFVTPEGIRYSDSADGAQWKAPEHVCAGSVDSRPTLGAAGGRALVGAVLGGRPVLFARGESGWGPVTLAPRPDTAAGPPSLSTDRHGTLWCAWASGGRVWAARWLGESFAPAIPAGAGGSLLLAEPAAPDTAPDLGLLAAGPGGMPRLLRVPIPGIAAAQDRALRFVDLLEVSRMAGIARVGLTPSVAGAIPPPASGEFLPGGIAAWDRRKGSLRAWFSRKEGDTWIGQTAEFARGAWGSRVPLRLAGPRPWLQPPSGALAVIVDAEDPDPGRRLKMLAERAGSAPALMTSTDGVEWAYYSELPPLSPLCLLRDRFAPADQRWRAWGRGQGGTVALSSPDREHWYAAEPPAVGAGLRDAVLWTEDDLVLGVSEGGRHLLAGRTAERVVPVMEMPAVAGDGQGRVFAPPAVWEGRRRLFLAAPDAWGWAEVPVGRWVGVRAAAETRPGVCETIPISLIGTAGRRLFVDASVPGNARVCVEALGPAGEPVAGYRAHLGRGEGWREVVWGRRIWRLEQSSVRLRFTVEHGAVLYGFRFSD